MLISACSDDHAPRMPSVSVEVKARGDGAFKIGFKISEPVSSLSFRPVGEGYREEHWSFASDEFVLSSKGELDEIERRDGAAFRHVEIVTWPGVVGVKKDYEPLTTYGEDGALFFTGHFWPVRSSHHRMDAAFSFRPGAGANTIAFGSKARALENWRSPLRHPAFVYLGPLAPIEAAHGVALIDPAAPQWVREEFDALTPAAFNYLGKALGGGLAAKPNLFLSAELSEGGRLSITGDALPGQYQLTLTGGAWREASDRGRAIFRRSVLHEGVHLWQWPARPAPDVDAPWIHEGGADAIAAEAMLALGFWDGAAYQRHLADARFECANGLRGGSLEEASARGDYHAVYACGHIIALAISTAERRTSADFWRGFIAHAQTLPDGYRVDDFFAYAEKRIGDPALIRRLRAFLRTPHASPTREIDRLLEAAGAAPIASAPAH